VYIVRPSKTSIDPDTLEAHHPDPVRRELRAVHLRPGQRMRDGTRVAETHEGYLISATSLQEPITSAGLIEDAGRARKIESVDEIVLGEVVIAYKAMVKR
jgi:hypothetical protein